MKKAAAVGAGPSSTNTTGQFSQSSVASTDVSSDDDFHNRPPRIRPQLVSEGGVATAASLTSTRLSETPVSVQKPIGEIPPECFLVYVSAKSSSAFVSSQTY